jgi:FtsH-binding integral membrane protein
MAIINCPGCNKKTTELSSKCPHCGFDRGEETDARKIELQRRAFRDRVYHLKMISYVVISLFLAAFGWYWWDTSGFLHQSTAAPIVLLAIIALAYLVMRVLLFRARKTLKQLGR